MILGVFPPYFVYTLLIILFIAIIFYWLIRSHRKESAMDILKRRYAGGEIDKETYWKMKEELAEE
ncbi:MAG: SHOCT domain-containing protein [Candidatus Altiarchaeota archaeon]|nr:SHOCT domain-containing protein [Candidatus Altiarchaeota archaeon]